MSGTDEAGNPFTATTEASGDNKDGGYEVDTGISKPTIDLVASSDSGKEDAHGSDTDNLTNDKTPTFALGNIDSDVAQADIVVLKDGVALDGTLENVDGTWQFTPSADLTDGTYDLSVTVTDDAGNSATSAELEVTIDTEAAATITVNAIAGDDIVNATEAAGTVAITGTVGGDAKPGDTVTLTLQAEGQDATTYTGTVGADGTYSINVPGSALASDADSTIVASVSGTDEAGNPFTATTDGDYDVDYAPVSTDFSVESSSDEPVQIDFNNPENRTSDVEDDAADANNNAALDVVITKLPNDGVLLYDDGSDKPYVITQQDIDDGTSFDSTKISYQANDGLGFLLGTKGEPDDSLKDSDGFLNWGVASTDDGKQRQVTLANGDLITITGSDVLEQFNDQKGEGGHIGDGIGIVGNSGIEKDDVISIDLSQEPVASVNLGLDGLGGLFDYNDTSNGVEVVFTISNGNQTTTVSESYLKSMGNSGVFEEVTYQAPDGYEIVAISFSTETTGNWELRYVEGLPSDDSFNYKVIDSQGVPSNESVVTIDNENAQRSPSVDAPHVVTQENSSHVFSWSDFKIDDVDTPKDQLIIIIDSLPEEGTITFDGIALSVGDEITYQQIQGGKLVFSPDSYDSSSSMSNEEGETTGNREADYANLGFSVSDGNSESSGKLVIDVEAKANTSHVDVSLLGAPTYEYTSYPSFGISTEQLQSGNFDASRFQLDSEKELNDKLPSQDSVDGFTEGNDYYRNVQGGGDYVFGKGGNDLLIGDDSRTGSYLDGQTGNDILVSGKGSDALYGGTGNDLAILPGKSTDYVIQKGSGYHQVNDIWFDFTTDEDFGSGFESITKALHSIEVVQFDDGLFNIDPLTGELTEVTPDFLSYPVYIDIDTFDVDGSESVVNITISGLIEGAQLLDSNDAVLGTADANGTIVMDNSWSPNGETYLVRIPGDQADNLDFNLSVATEESSNSDTAMGVDSVRLTGFNGHEAELGVQHKTYTDEHDIVVGDFEGNVVTPGQSYNLAFMVDTSGSLNQNQVDGIKAQLRTVFSTLKTNIDSANAGIVNILLIDFDYNPNNLSISVDLSDSNAISQLETVITSMTAGGGTNYEDVFKATANWYSSLASSDANNVAYLITDGKPTAYNADSSQDGWDDDETVIRPDGQGGQEQVTIVGGSSVDDIDKSEASAAYALLQAQGVTVEAIGVGDNIETSYLETFDSDVDNNIAISDLAETILAIDVAHSPTSDALRGRLGDDIIFGDSISFNGVDGQGLEALQNYVAAQLGQDSVSDAELHTFISQNVSDLDLSESNHKADELFGQEGSDILFGQGGDDTLVGGLGNDILIGGDGDDIFKWIDEPLGNHEDVIVDFTRGEDHIDLSELVDGNEVASMQELLDNIEVSVDADNSANLQLSITKGGETQEIILENASSQFDAEISNGSVSRDVLDDILKLNID